MILYVQKKAMFNSLLTFINAKNVFLYNKYTKSRL